MATDRYRLAVVHAGIAGHDGSRVQLGNPTAPIAIPRLDDEGTFPVLMAVRLS